jgi:catechol 2,3-dioxygenase-like lactoylglutathione lyase family enzyme
MKVQFIASVAAITADPPVSRALYVDALGLPLNHADGDDYEHSEDIDGSKHFGVWPLRQAALACFGSDDWPADRPIPQASFEAAPVHRVLRPGAARRPVTSRVRAHESRAPVQRGHLGW